MSKRIIITNRWSDWHVHLEGDMKIWDSGKTIGEAIGSFCMAHPSRVPSPFRIVIVRPSKAALNNAPTMKDRELSESLGKYCEILNFSPDGLMPNGGNSHKDATVGKL